MCFSLRRADAGRLNRFSEKFQNFLRTLRQNSAIARAMALTPSDRNTAFTRTGSLTRNKWCCYWQHYDCLLPETGIYKERFAFTYKNNE